MRLSILAAAILLFGAGSSAASAQTAHQRAAGDTLRFLQTLTMSQAMESEAMGSMTTSMNTVSRVVVVFGRGDTITAWVDSASTRVSSPNGEATPDVSSLLNRKQVVTLSAAGSLAIVSDETVLPAEMAGMKDMVPETLKGLELEVPKEPLRKGAVWTDTTDAKSAPGAESTFDNRTITRYEVVGDSAVAGRPVLVIESKGTADIDMTMVMGGGGMTVKGKTAAMTSGRLYYSPQLGLLLKRVVSNDAKGSQDVTGDMAMTFAVTQKTEELTTVIQ